MHDCIPPFRYGAWEQNMISVGTGDVQVIFDACWRRFEEKYRLGVSFMKSSIVINSPVLLHLRV